MSTLDTFRSLGLSEETLAALHDKGFEEPSAIQNLTIPKLLSGDRDVIGQAQTGTGKTAAFGLPILEILQSAAGPGAHPRAIVLTPTRELSIQVAEEIASFLGSRRLRIAPFYGGQSIEIQLQRIKLGVDVVIGTPGRILDLMERGALKLDALRFAVLDEADEMLNMGFLEDIREILAQTNPDKRMLMFSATMPPEIQAIAEQFMQNPEIIRTVTAELGAGLTEQIYFEVRREDKLEALSRIIDIEEDLYAMVFCRTRNDVDELTEKLKLRGHNVESLHGDIAQAQRLRVINGFKERKFKLLIATDVAARGIDVNDLTHVINYSIPEASETYVHRIGRTGRAGKSGTAITFVTPAEYRKLTTIQKSAKTNIRKEQLPAGKEVVDAKKQRFAERIGGILAKGVSAEYRAFARELVLLGDEPDDLLAALLQLKFRRGELCESSYENLTPVSRKREFGNHTKSFTPPPDERGRARLFIGVGKADGFLPPQILAIIDDKAGVSRSRIGKIDCFDKFSFVNVYFNDAERIVQAFKQDGPSVEIAGKSEDSREKRPYKKPFRRDRDEARSHTGRSYIGDGTRSSSDRSERPPRPYRDDKSAWSKKDRKPLFSPKKRRPKSED